MRLVQRDGVLRQRHHPDGKLHGIALQAPRQSMAVPALIELAEIFADLFRQADPLRDPLRHLAVAGENRNADLHGLGKALLDGLGELIGRHVREVRVKARTKISAEFRLVAHVDARARSWRRAISSPNAEASRWVSALHPI